MIPNVNTNQRITIIGGPGSGKSTLAKALAKDLGFVPKSIDDIYWQNGWERPEEKKFQTDLKNYLANDQWIVDGHFLSTIPTRMAHSTHIIYLKYPLPVVICRYFAREVKRWKGCDENYPANVTDSRVRLHVSVSFFFRKVLFFNLRHERKTLKLFEQYHHSRLEIKILKHPDEGDDIASLVKWIHGSRGLLTNRTD